jgi:alpha-galactosidase
MKKITLFIVLLLCTATYAQKFNGLAKTPPMGWNSWNRFRCDVNEKLVREAAEAMVSSGMRDAGYIYINIDDCWHGERDSLGFIQADPKRFPSGMKALADYVHSLGLKFGIYTDAGWQTCAGKPGSRGYEYQDAISYAKWGVDYVKDDFCFADSLDAHGSYLTMRNAFYAAGRPVVFSLCEGGDHKPWEWGAEVGHLWRTTCDIYAAFDSLESHNGWHALGVLNILNLQKSIRKYSGPDHWNDPDMLEVGNGMSVNEDRAHFSMWCMLAAPLISGNDLFHMSKETSEILKNKDAIAVDQDTLGISGFVYSQQGPIEIWAKPLAYGEWAVCFLNSGREVKDVNFSWNENKIVDTLTNRELNPGKDKYTISDLWKHKDIGSTNKDFSAAIPSHDVVLLRLKPAK